MSKRTDIRNAIATALKGATSAADSVMTSRYRAFKAKALPLVLVYTPDEELDSFVNYPRQYARKVKVVTMGLIQANDDVDDAIDEMQSDIEAAMHKDPTFGGLAMGTVLQKVSSEVDPSGESQYAAAHAEWEVTYVE